MSDKQYNIPLPELQERALAYIKDRGFEFIKFVDGKVRYFDLQRNKTFSVSLRTFEDL